MTGQTAIPASPSSSASVDSLLAKRSSSEPRTPPKDRPQFTVSMIRELIPAHCFERSAAKSFAYLGWVCAVPESVRCFFKRARCRNIVCAVCRTSP